MVPGTEPGGTNLSFLYPRDTFIMIGDLLALQARTRKDGFDNFLRIIISQGLLGFTLSGT